MNTTILTRRLAKFLWNVYLFKVYDDSNRIIDAVLLACNQDLAGSGW